MIHIRTFRVYFLVLIMVPFMIGAGLPSMAATNNCDQALSYFWKGKNAAQKAQALRFYQKAINLCPGFIRPYELAGNLHRKEGRNEKAIKLFTRAAQLGTTNYKLYYLLALLQFERGELDEASRNLNKSLSIRGDYPKSLELQIKIERSLDKSGPKIILFEPATRRGLKVVYKSEIIAVRGIATDKSGVFRVRVNQNDALLDKRGNFLKNIHLRLGSNNIIVEAVDKVGNPSRLAVSVIREKTFVPQPSSMAAASPIKVFYEKSIAVVIGINRYEQWPVLEFAVNDALAIKKKLAATGFDEITMIIDREATQRRILTELFYELPRKVGRNDRVLFYFAGHGQTEELADGGKKGYIIPVDADTFNYASTAISMQQIRSLTSRIPAKHILFVMDSCYSGLGLSRSYGISRKVSGYLRKVASMRVVQIVTAGGKGEQVQERQGHGLFTTYFLRALDGEADINKDRVVTGTELGAYIRPMVSDASRQAQTPLYGRLEGEGEFLFFVNRK